MNSNITALLKARDSISSATQAQVAALDAQLQAEYNKVFDHDKTLCKALENLDSSSEYSHDRNGDIVRWYRYGELGNVETHVRPYLETWVQDRSCASIDWENDCFQSFEGDCIVVQAEHGRDNGVWYAGKCIIDESEYRDDGEDACEEKRNALIEAYMARIGEYPTVLRCTYHGDLFPLSTQSKEHRS